jgi:hypothetical protein
LALFFVSPVLANDRPCWNGIAELRDDEALAGRIADARPALRKDLRAYVETAIDLESRGQRAACEAVVDAVRALVTGDQAGPREDASAQSRCEGATGSPLRDGSESSAKAQHRFAADRHTQSQEASSKSAESEAAARATDDTTTQDFDADASTDSVGRDLAQQTSEEEQPVWESYDYSEGAKRAEPFETVAERISSEQIVDADVRSLDGRALGVAEGFLTTHEGITDVIVSYGGFLDIGDRDVAVPVDRLRYDRVDGVFYTSLDRGWLDDQPDWDEGSWFSEPNFWLRDP